MKRAHLSRVGFSLALLACTQSGSAATFCVDTTVELQDALSTAASNNADDVIRIKTGTYTGTLGLAFAHSTQQNFDLTLQGGWETFFTFDCGRRNDDPRVTVLSGSDARPVLRVSAFNTGGSGAVAIENLTLRDGLATNSARGAGLNVGGIGFTGDIRVERVYFTGNVSGSFAGGASILTGGIIELRNNWFRNNRCTASYCAALVSNSVPMGNTVRTFIGNNTVVNNSCSAGAPPSCDTGGIGLTGTARASVYNNLFFSNGGNDFKTTTNGANFDLFFNNIDLIDGTPTNTIGNVNEANPQFVNSLLGDYRLRFTSPLRDAGTTSFVLGALDFNGLPRINGNGVDIGAFENDEIVFRNGFEPPAQ